MRKPFIGVVVGLIFAASAASAALAALPGVTSEGTAPPKVRPKMIVYSGDGGAFFAGAHEVSKGNFGSLAWSKWSKTKAVGSGANWLDNCKPDCARGTFHGYPVSLKLTRPKMISGKNVFTRLLVTYTSKAPSHTPTSQTWTLRHSSSKTGTFFFWHQPA